MAVRPVKKIFVSYSSKDRKIVNNLVAWLRKKSFDVWYDQDISGGQDWWATILENIENCDIFLFVASIASLDSPACQDERAYALTLQKPVLPVIAEPEAEHHVNFQPLKAKINFIKSIKDTTDIITAINLLPFPPALSSIGTQIKPLAPISELTTIQAEISNYLPIAPDRQKSIINDIRWHTRQITTEDEYAIKLLTTFIGRNEITRVVADEAKLLRTELQKRQHTRVSSNNMLIKLFYRIPFLIRVVILVLAAVWAIFTLVIVPVFAEDIRWCLLDFPSCVTHILNPTGSATPTLTLTSAIPTATITPEVTIPEISSTPTPSRTPSPTSDGLITLEIYRTPNWLQLYVPTIPDGYILDLSSLEFRSASEAYPMSNYTAFVSRLSTITAPTCFGIYIAAQLPVEDWEEQCESLSPNQRFADNDLGLGDKFWTNGQQFTTVDIYLRGNQVATCPSGSFDGAAFECEFDLIIQ